MMTNKVEFKIVCLYFFIIAMVLLYGTGLITKAYNYREADLAYTKKEIILEDNVLRLAFCNGYITMYHGETKFTEDSGLACFFTVKEADYATYKGIWKIEKFSLVELLASVRWPGLPFSQIWHILLKDEKLIWHIDLESSEDIMINLTGLVFSFKNNYQEWANYYEQGRMPVLDVLQQRKDVRFTSVSGAVGLIASDKDAKLFPAVELSLGKGVFLNKVLLSVCRDMFSGAPFSSISVGGVEPLRVLKNSRMLLSSGEINLFDKRGDLLKNLLINKEQVEN